jgi:hypothetical protein
LRGFTQLTLSIVSRSAPDSMRRETASRSPLTHAKWRGVLPDYIQNEKVFPPSDSYQLALVLHGWTVRDPNPSADPSQMFNPRDQTESVPVQDTNA